MVRHCPSQSLYSLDPRSPDIELTFGSKTDVFQLPVQNSLIDQVVLDNQDVRPRTDRRRRGGLFACMALFQGRTLAGAFSIMYTTLCLSRAGLDEETERRPLAVFRGDLYTASH